MLYGSYRNTQTLENQILSIWPSELISQSEGFTWLISQYTRIFFNVGYSRGAQIAPNPPLKVLVRPFSHDFYMERFHKRHSLVFIDPLEGPRGLVSCRDFCHLYFGGSIQVWQQEAHFNASFGKSFELTPKLSVTNMHVKFWLGFLKGCTLGLL